MQKRVATYTPKKSIFRRIGKAIAGVIVCVVLFCVAANLITLDQTSGEISDANTVASKAGQEPYTDMDCILVLGASVNPDGSPSAILKDRLDAAYTLYRAGVASKIIVSGDNSSASYNEVRAMKNYLVQKGVSADVIFCDHAGYDTYDSVYRAQSVFGVHRMIIVSNGYHLPRAVEDARMLGIDAWGASSDTGTYDNMMYYNVREIGARIKDFAQAIVHKPSTRWSSSVSLDESGTVTDW